MLERLGEPEPLGNPIDELLAIGAEGRAWLTVLREQVARLNSLSSTDIAHVERARAVVELYTQALRDSERLLTSLAKLELDERRTRLAEAQAVLLARVLERVLRAAGVDPLGDRIRAVIATELEAVSG